MNRSDERLLWIVGILLLLWLLFRRAGFRLTGAVGPIGGSLGLGTGEFSGLPGGGGGGLIGFGGGCCGGCAPAPIGPVTGDYGDYAQG